MHSPEFKQALVHLWASFPSRSVHTQIQQRYRTQNLARLQAFSQQTSAEMLRRNHPNEVDLEEDDFESYIWDGSFDRFPPEHWSPEPRHIPDPIIGTPKVSLEEPPLPEIIPKGLFPYVGDKFPRKVWSPQLKDIPHFIVGQASQQSVDSVRSRRPPTPHDRSRRSICICLSKTRGLLYNHKSENYGWSIAVVDQGKQSNSAEYSMEDSDSSFTMEKRYKDPIAQLMWREFVVLRTSDLFSKSHLCLINLELILEVLDECKIILVLQHIGDQLSHEKISSSKVWVERSLNELARVGALKRRTWRNKPTRPWESAWRRIEKQGQEYGVLVDKASRRWTQSLITTGTTSRRAEIPMTIFGASPSTRGSPITTPGGRLNEGINIKPQKGKNVEILQQQDL